MMTYEGLRRHLEGLVGTDNVWTDEIRIAAHAVHGRQPRVVVQPETMAQAAEIVALAGRERLACLALAPRDRLLEINRRIDRLRFR